MKPEVKPTEKNKGGRPIGSMSRIATESRERALATGMLPHEILLSMARGEPQPMYVVDPKTGKITHTAYETPDLEQRKDAAKAGAPYFAPKISTVEVISGVADHELDRIIAQLAAEAGLSTGAGGEGETDEQGELAAAKPRRRVRVE